MMGNDGHCKDGDIYYNKSDDIDNDDIDYDDYIDDNEKTSRI